MMAMKNTDLNFRRKQRKPSYLSFQLGQENYAVSATKVLEVLEPMEITPVPNSYISIIGVIPFRGKIIPVLSMRERLKLNYMSGQEEYVIIVFDLEADGKKSIVAGIADCVNEVIAANDEEIREIGKAAFSFDESLVKGVLKSNEQFAMVLDVDAFFEIS